MYPFLPDIKVTLDLTFAKGTLEVRPPFHFEKCQKQNEHQVVSK